MVMQKIFCRSSRRRERKVGGFLAGLDTLSVSLLGRALGLFGDFAEGF